MGYPGRTYGRVVRGTATPVGMASPRGREYGGIDSLSTTRPDPPDRRSASGGRRSRPCRSTPCGRGAFVEVPSVGDCAAGSLATGAGAGAGALGGGDDSLGTASPVRVDPGGACR